MGIGYYWLCVLLVSNQYQILQYRAALVLLITFNETIIYLKWFKAQAIHICFSKVLLRLFFFGIHLAWMMNRCRVGDAVQIKVER